MIRVRSSMDHLTMRAGLACAYAVNRDLPPSGVAASADVRWPLHGPLAPTSSCATYPCRAEVGST